MKKLYLYGSGGHSRVIIDICEENNIRLDGILEDNITDSEFLGYDVLKPQMVDFVNGQFIYGIGNNATRKRLSINQPGSYSPLIHPRASISKSSKIGNGTIVMAGATISSFTTIGIHVIINTNCSIDHECIIEDYVHISPQVGLAGNVEVGEGAHIGIGANVIQGIKIGKWATVGAGAVVIRDVPDYAVVVGNPARTIKYNTIK